ncbi:dihydrofolate reductase family protein [Planomonospora parontospora]|uniref:dihydrofolate reductase family protein n=1 Tax=Planomonospora parontospora TaxID=58119 RepID=UPI00166FABE0|nr:dihydrofolate reductase family protein [Planomonospora parontospora]GGL46737.1 riboflavin biosynthesis protein RibD [Planomonospora parontospora subsp. antibiotica]GII19423.1 riboflavin biosynthesis protein RibD [Planomonospora parontospora subsp. antibiotica]
MRNLTVWMQMSLDGYTEGPHGEFDWPVVEPEVLGYFVDLASRFDTFLFGRKVYEMMAGYWPTADRQDSSTDYERAYAPIWRDTPKIVFSETLQHARWNTTVINGDLAAEVTRLKQQPGKGLVLFGGSQIAHELMDLGLVDEYRLFIHPTALGAGRPLFGAGRTDLTLADARTFDNAVVHLHYRTRATPLSS